jgi:asparagine synthase (glutamine-hydrolysing)
VLPELVYHYDEPFADSSAIPTYYVSKIAREHVTVVLSGDGGDENFGGYLKYAATLRILRLRAMVPRFVRERVLPVLYRLTPQFLPGRNIINMVMQDEEMVYTYKMRFFNDDVLRDLFVEPVSARNVFEPYIAKVAGAPHISRMQYIDLKTYLPMDILTKVDRASMAFGLETRVPLLDYRIVEYAAKIPPALHVHDDSKKYLLKRILSDRFGFDESFLNRRKRGFEVPLSRWFKGTLERFARENLCDGDSAVGELLDRGFIETLIARHTRGVRDYSSQIWAMLFLEFWLRRWRRT